ncbi:LysE family translocator [Abyssalbus ytuae]|uniref:LysE family translocator n=1 Tax=Abyssalbus ytuae TaxID=2926907 RepID=A0A9E6ZUS5_9FLAO|nr:LysE family transporter [Abyssalbus ytuae]UOB19323.1 LysE family translocator [Abyssalbus ytuae]
MIHDILSAIPWGILLSFTIGPVFFVLLETSAIKGFRAGFTFDLGVILADIIFILVAFYSTSNILDKIKDDPNFLILGGVILTTYGIISFLKTNKSFRKIVKEYHRVGIDRRYGRLFVKGFLLNFINIGVLIGWIGLIIIGNSVTSSKNGVFLFLVTTLITYFFVDLIKISLAKTLKSKLTPRRIFKTKKIISLIILGFGILLILQGFFPKEKERIKDVIEDIRHNN